MKKNLILLLVVVMLSNCFCISSVASTPEFSIVSASVQNGDEDVGICPVLAYEFSKEIDSASTALATFNADSSYIRSCELDSSGKKLTMRLARELMYDSWYTLDLSALKDIDGNALGTRVTFKTKYGDNSTDKVWIKEDNFETGVYNESKWRPGDAPLIKTIAKDGDNGNSALYLSSATGNRLQCYNSTPMLSTQGMVAVSFAINVESSTGAKICDIAAGGTCAGVLKIAGDGKLQLTDFGADGSLASEQYIDAGSWEAGQWIDVRFVVDIEQGTYTAYLDGTQLTPSADRDYFTLKKGVFTSDTATSVRFQTNAVAYYLDDVSISRVERPFGLESSTVADGDTGVSVNPKLSFDFNRRISSDGFTPLLNGSADLIESYEISSSDDSVLNIKLDGELAEKTAYVLDLSSLKDIYGNPFGKTITFTTVDNTVTYNVVYDDFESGKIDTTRWRVNGDKTTNLSVVEITADPIEAGNDVVHLLGVSSDGTNHSAQFDNYQKLGANGMPGDVVLEYRFMLPEAMLAHGYRPWLEIASGVSNSSLMYTTRNSAKDGFAVQFKNSDATYTTVGTVKANEWIKIAMVIDPEHSTYQVYVNDVLYDHTFEFVNRYTADAITQVIFKAHVGYEIYLDDITIAQRLALVPNASGEYECFADSDGNAISELDSERTIHKATFVNNGPADEAMHLFLALYDSDTNELKELKQQSFTVKKKAHYKVELGFENLGAKARNHFVKAIYVNNENKIIPYRHASIPADSLCITEDTGIPEVIVTYPNGLKKAVTFNIDDGNPLDKDFVALMNKYNMKATFNMVGNRADGSYTQVNGIPTSEFAEVYAGHELASHSYSYFSSILTDEDFEADLLKAEKLIEDCGFAVSGYAYPNGKTGDSTTDYQKILADNGYVYARTTRYTNSFDIPSADELLCLDMTQYIGNVGLIAMSELAHDYIDLKRKDITLFSIWGHSHDISDTNTSKLWTWAEWEQFCSVISGRSEIWYATCHDIYSYIAAADKLQIGATSVTNPTEVDLWCTVDGDLVKVEAGGTYEYINE